jgi:hypothetical protein
MNRQVPTCNVEFCPGKVEIQFVREDGGRGNNTWIGHGPSSFQLSSARFKRVEIESLAKEKPNAVDNFRNFSGVMAPRTRYFLHDGWFHPYPVGPGHCCRFNSCHPGPKSNYIIAEARQMKSITMLGILLVILGGLALAYQGFSYTRREKIIDIGPIHATADTQEHVPLPPIVGGLALAAGVVLLVMGAKQKP